VHGFAVVVPPPGGVVVPPGLGTLLPPPHAAGRRDTRAATTSAWVRRMEHPVQRNVALARRKQKTPEPPWRLRGPVYYAASSA
jgi:hypothetical protein